MLDALIEIGRQIEITANQLPEEGFEWNEEKEEYETVRAPPTDGELAAVEEVRDLVEQLYLMLWEVRVAAVGAELRAELSRRQGRSTQCPL